jgi:SAM-dependent methyltransferase
MGTDETVASAAMDLSERGPATARHPWEIERFRAYCDVLRDHGALAAKRVLDVGAGDGWFSESLLAELPDAEQVVCWDVNYNELELTTDDPRLVRTTVAPSPGFDLVLVLDVLEHIADPVTFIAEQLRPLTAAGTAVLVAVPAHPALFGDHDRALGHCRRYRPSELLDQLHDWIGVEERGPLFTSLVLPRAAAVAVERLRPGRPAVHGVGGWEGGPLLTRTLGGVLRADARITRRLGRRAALARRIPGLSHWVFGRVR